MATARPKTAFRHVRRRVKPNSLDIVSYRHRRDRREINFSHVRFTRARSRIFASLRIPILLARWSINTTGASRYLRNEFLGKKPIREWSMTGGNREHFRFVKNHNVYVCDGNDNHIPTPLIPHKSNLVNVWWWFNDESRSYSTFHMHVCHRDYRISRE